MTIYAGAIILGGDTVIGKGSTVNGSVFITHSIPAYHTVSMEPPKLSLKQSRRTKKAAKDAGTRDLKI